MNVNGKKVNECELTTSDSPFAAAVACEFGLCK